MAFFVSEAFYDVAIDGFFEMRGFLSTVLVISFAVVISLYFTHHDFWFCTYLLKLERSAGHIRARSCSASLHSGKLDFGR
jgi:hypothetical protein